MLKSLIKKVTPSSVLNFYHKAMALLAAFVYGNPSEKLIVIGVTGTNGKTTTVNYIASALVSAGFKVGVTSTVNFRVADQEWLNNKKMTMLGRFQLQKLLKQMVDAGCTYAVIETSSQGIEQYRHLGINYDYAVFTNLTPEHIEAHGGFENYKRAKGKLFEHLAKKRKKTRLDSPLSGVEPSRTINHLPAMPSKAWQAGKINKTIVANADDEHAGYFLEFNADKKIKYGIKNESADLVGKNVEVTTRGTSFEINGVKINMKMLGAFNVYNALPAVAVALEEGLSLEQIKKGLESIAGVPGRMEVIDEGQPFTVIVDYAPEPASMGKLYETVATLRGFSSSGQKALQGDNRVIHVLGSCGGGRDKARRPVLGRLAGKNADVVIVTNEDPYDDDPMEIINEVAAGAIEEGSPRFDPAQRGVEAGKELGKTLFKVLDRKEAIGKAIGLAKAGDLVLITGKGAEQAMAVADGRLIPWDDRKIARTAIREKKDSGSPRFDHAQRGGEAGKL